MRKLETFRAAFLGASPRLAENPQNVSIAVERGRVVSTGVPALGAEYHYQITAIAQDFAGDFDAVAHAVLQWARQELPGMLMNPEKRDTFIRFEVERISNELIDLMVEVDVVEPMTTQDGRTFEHPMEQPVDSFERLMDGR